MPALPPKKAVALDLLERASMFVHLDPRKPGVVVPGHLATQPQLVLQIGLNMAVSIPDLDVAEDGIHCTLSFNRRACYCVLPWSAIYALIGEPGTGGMVWPEDVPPEVVAQQSRAARARPRRRHLRAVGGAEGSISSDSEPDSASGSRAAEAGGRVRRNASRRPEIVEPGADDPRLAVVERAVVPADAAAESAAAESAGDGSSDVASESSRRGVAGPRRVRPPYLRLVE